MMARAGGRRRGRGARNPGIIVHKLLWSMSYSRRVRITLRDGRVTTKQVKRIWRDATPPAKLSREASTVGVVFVEGGELRVDAIERVQLPLGDSGAAFGEDS